MIFAAFALSGLSSAAFADMGTPEEQAACRPDVRKFCYKIPQSAGDKAFQQCLEANRDKLSANCVRVMMEHKR
jgi:hypothetical protein